MKKTRQKLGQHFLGGESWRRRIGEKLRARPGEVWLEIGPGHGEMTEVLAESVASKIVVVETDRELARELRDGRGGQSGWKNVEVVEGDILEVDLARIFADLAGVGPAAKRARVYGNLPYYITSPILRRLFEFARQIASIDVVIQEEVAERIVAKPRNRDYGYLSVLCQFYSEPKILLRIPAGAFRPPPKVDSAMVEMRVRERRAFTGKENEEKFLGFVGRCFEHKRKTLRNNLRGEAEGKLQQAFNSVGIEGNARAEELTLDQFMSLFKAFSN